VRHPGDHLAQTGQFLRLYHLALRLFQCEMGTVFGQYRLLKVEILDAKLLLGALALGERLEELGLQV
jgi:hypothetical protein